MKTLNDYSGWLTDYQEPEQKEILNIFVNELILDLNAKLSKEEVKHLQFRVYSIINTKISIKQLKRIRSEIVENYKKYIPFCYASIAMASKITAQ